MIRPFALAIITCATPCCAQSIQGIPPLDQVYDVARGVSAAQHCNLIDETTGLYAQLNEFYRIFGTITLDPQSDAAQSRGWEAGMDEVQQHPALCTTFSQGLLASIRTDAAEFRARNTPPP